MLPVSKSEKSSTYIADCLNECLVCANFGLLQGSNARSDPGDERKLLSPAHLITSFETDISIHSLFICKGDKEAKQDARGVG